MNRIKELKIYEFDIEDFRKAIKRTSKDMISSEIMSNLISKYIENRLEDFLNQHIKE